MSDPIATRVLKSLDHPEPVYLELERPELFLSDFPAEGAVKGNWSCAYRIRHGSAVVLEARAVGSDSLQAIVNAITQLRARLSQTGLRAEYEHAFEGTGLPDYLPQGFGVEFERYLKDLVDREVHKRAKALEDAQRTRRTDEDE
jgi:hypothetical protein